MLEVSRTAARSLRRGFFVVLLRSKQFVLVSFFGFGTRPEGAIVDIRNAIVSPWQGGLSMLMVEQSPTTVRRLFDGRVSDGGFGGVPADGRRAAWL